MGTGALALMLVPLYGTFVNSYDFITEIKTIWPLFGMFALTGGLLGWNLSRIKQKQK